MIVNDYVCNNCGRQNPTLESVQPKTMGEYIVIKPSKETWDQLSKIQEFANEKMTGVESWKATDYQNAHLTLYAGFETPLTLDQKRALMKEIAQQVSTIQPFCVKIDLKKTSLETGGKYLVFKFDDEKLMELQSKVKVAVENFKKIQNENLLTKKDLKYVDIGYVKTKKTNGTPTVSKKTNEIQTQNFKRYTASFGGQLHRFDTEDEIRTNIENTRNEKSEVLVIDVNRDAKKFDPHFTIGVLDINKNIVHDHIKSQAPHSNKSITKIKPSGCCDVALLRAKMGADTKKAYEIKSQNSNEFGDVIHFHVNEVVLVGANDFNAKLENKINYQLASAHLGLQVRNDI